MFLAKRTQSDGNTYRGCGDSLYVVDGGGTAKQPDLCREGRLQSWLSLFPFDRLYQGLEHQPLDSTNRFSKVNTNSKIPKKLDRTHSTHSPRIQIWFGGTHH